jgi:hypothetical protein
MKIGFDLDKVFVDYPPFVPDRLIDKLYKKKANGILLYRIPTRPEQFVRRISHYPLLRPPIQKNVAFLKSISKKNNELYLISSRFGFLEKQTKHLVERLGLSDVFDGMYFNFENKQPHLFKNDVLKKLDLDIYVDDDFHLLKYVAKDNSHTKLFWLVPKKHDLIVPKAMTPITELSAIMSKNQ